MPASLESLKSALEREFDGRVLKLTEALGELTLEIAPGDLVDVALQLRDHPELRFEQLIDLCGVDYGRYGNKDRDPPRFAVVYHLLSITHNRRLRLRTFAQQDALPVVRSVVDIWPAANWFEREAFDLFGIVFEGHPDLRRILTDYGFIGHPFRKDFPLSGNVEMRYDPDQQRVIYQPVTIEPREIVPRVTREDNYGDVDQ
jgi:NADH-quinone oxidoreductase subunit C